MDFIASLDATPSALKAVAAAFALIPLSVYLFYKIVGALIARSLRVRATRGKVPVPICNRHSVLGNAKNLMSPTHHLEFDALRRELGDVFLMHMAFGDASFFVTNPKFVADLVPFGSEHELPKFEKAYEPFNMVFTNKSTGLNNTIFTEGDTPKWRNVRKTMAVCFSHSAMKRRYHFIRDRALAMVEVLGGKAEAAGGSVSIDTFYEFNRLTLDVFFSAGFDKHIGLLEAGNDHVRSEGRACYDIMIMYLRSSQLNDF